jgi:hypothetical protein
MKKRMPTILLGLLLALSAGPARADEPAWQDSLLDRFVGRWVLSGEIAGQKTTHDVTAEWALVHHYLRIHEVSRERDARGQPQYEAIVTIGADGAPDRYACLWLDSTAGSGLVNPPIGRATRSGDELPFVFVLPDSSTFRTILRYERAVDAWRWSMDAVSDRKTRPFARLTMIRKPARGGGRP